MKKILVITGDLATGKTSYSKLLSARYQALVYNKDTIKEVLGDTIGFANREENLKLSKATMQLMFFLTRNCIALGQDVILEANFHEQELNSLVEIAKEGNYSILTLRLFGDDRLLHSRYLNRIHNENRHPVHLSTTFEIFEDFQAYLIRSRKENIPTEHLDIDANDFEYKIDPKILAYIDKFMKD